ncbi:MAG: hypothetical protein O3A14_16080, partial [Cyanobacteria bacterium]|nr:hypothetical protein [Cyanobacteriota bacterium]
MSNPSHPVSSHSPQTRAELDLLHSVLEAESQHYWNPQDPNNAPYLAALEATWEEEDFSGATLAAKAQQLWEQAGQLWPASPSLGLRLKAEFESRMPADLLGQIAERVQAIAENGRPLLDQLVAAVDDSLTGWDAGDLRVIARPMAMAMRDGHGDIVEATLNSIRPDADWDALSDLEKARLSLAIARYGFAHLN